MDQRIIDLYDNFTHGALSRREFMDRLAKLAGSSAAAVALLPVLQNDYARAAIVPAGDARLATERLSFDSSKGRIGGYLARPKENNRRPAILVIHENRGLSPHLEDVARRFALEGFLAYAIDLLSLVGGTPPSEDDARALHTKLNQDDAVAALTDAVAFLKRHPESNGKAGAVALLFRRADGQSPRGDERGTGRGRCLLWTSGSSRSGAEHPCSPASALCGERRGRECGDQEL